MSGQILRKMTPFLKYMGINFGIQTVGWAASVAFKTEKFYDLVGSATYITLASLSLAESRKSTIQIVQSNLVLTWALRLGLFLFVRVIKSGEDRRFEEAKRNPGKMFLFWMMQGIWVGVTLLPTLILNTLPSSRISKPMGPATYIGWTLWGIGFLFEVVADFQKSIFRNNPDNRGTFIQSGLWSISRHPNYFGEILLWYGHYIAVAPFFKNYEFFSVLSPIFVHLLITKVSGIPLLEKSAKEKWGHLESYQKYVDKTSVLIPFLNWKM